MGIWVGGTVYQMVAVVAIWSVAPSESFRAFFQGAEYNRTIFHFFGPPFMTARLIPTIIAFALGVAVVCLAAKVIFALAYVYPINAVLFEQAGGAHSVIEITDMVRTWIGADRIRFGVGIVAFVAILRAFRLPLPRQ